MTKDGIVCLIVMLSGLLALIFYEIPQQMASDGCRGGMSHESPNRPN